MRTGKQSDDALCFTNVANESIISNVSVGTGRQMIVLHTDMYTCTRKSRGKSRSHIILSDQACQLKPSIERLLTYIRSLMCISYHHITVPVSLYLQPIGLRRSNDSCQKNSGMNPKDTHCIQRVLVTGTRLLH